MKEQKVEYPAEISMNEEENQTDFITKDELLGYLDIIYEKVSIPEWGGKAVYVGTMSAKERDEFESSIISQRQDGSTERNLENFRAKLCALTIYNKNKRRMFNFEEAVKLGKKSASAIDRIFSVAQKINGIGQRDIEELTKNSQSGPNADLLSDSVSSVSEDVRIQMNSIEDSQVNNSQNG